MYASQKRSEVPPKSSADVENIKTAESLAPSAFGRNVENPGMENRWLKRGQNG